MFPRRYYAGRMFAPVYFPQSQGEIGASVPPITNITAAYQRTINIDAAYQRTVNIDAEIE